MKKPIKKNLPINIVFFISAPLVVALLVSSIIVNHNFNQAKKVTTSNFYSNIQEFNATNKKMVSQLVEDLSASLSFDSMKQLFSVTEFPSTLDSTTTEAQQLMRLFKQNNEMVYDIYLINRHANFVLTETTLTDLNTFFGDYNTFNDYDLNHWKNLKSPSISNLLLNSTYIKSHEGQHIVIPYISFTRTFPTDDTYVILSLDLEYFYNLLSSSYYTQGTLFYLMDNTDHRFNNGYEYIDNPFGDYSFSEKMSTNLTAVSEHIKSNSEKYYVLSASSTNSLFNHTYIVAIPESDFLNITVENYLPIIFTIIFEIILLIFFAFISYDKVYIPLKNISQLMADAPDLNYGFFENVFSFIHATNENTKTMNNKLSYTLPLGVKQYILNVINTAGFDRNLQFENSVFKYKYFYPLTVEILFEKEYYVDYAILNNNLELIEIIKNQFENTLTTFVINQSQTTLSLLFVIPDEKAIEIIDNTIVETKNLFQADRKYISLYFGKGYITDDILKLKDAFSEAYNNINKELNVSKGVSSSEKYAELYKYQEEIQLTNYLMNAKISLAVSLVNNISDKLKTVPRDLMQKVFSNVIYTIHKVLTAKQITYNDTITDEATFIANICSGTQDMIYSYCMECIDKISEHSQFQKKKISISDIVDYIQAHIYEDITLNTLSSKFGTSPQYISKKIKEYLGVSFHDYVSSKKIDKAKQLLQNSNKSVNDICEEVGFFSRNTFLRTFKKLVGVSPLDYKKEIKAQKIKD